MRYIEEHSGEPCIIDDLYFCDDKALHNGYELEKIFSLKPRRLSQMLSEDVVQEILKLKQPAPGPCFSGFILKFVIACRKLT